MPVQGAELLPAGQHFEQRHATDVITAGQQAAIRGKHSADVPMLVIDVTGQERQQFCRGADFPDLDVPVLVPAGQHEPVRREGEGVDGMVVTAEQHSDELAGLGVPQADRPVGGPAGQHLSVR